MVHGVVADLEFDGVEVEIQGSVGDVDLDGVALLY